jgi:ABC-type Fe3+ transport system permease subunit
MTFIPLAHMGHAVAVMPFFAPPLVLTFGLIVLTVRDRLKNRDASADH